MKKCIIKIVLLLFYSMPYVFLSMNGDASSGTMAFYGLMIVAFGTLCYISKRTNNKIIVVIGNICSFMVSFICLILLRWEKWDWYFKPLTDVQLMIIVSSVAAIIQFIIIFRKKNNNS